MDYAVNSLRIESLTPEKAADYLKCNYTHNRKMRRHHVEYLLNEMKAGRFMPTAEVHLMYRNGEPVLVNGQHTCAAIVEFGKPVTVTVRKTIAREAGQIAMTYAFGHDTGLHRTFNDAMGAYNIAEQTGLTSDQVNALSTALRHILADFTGESDRKRNDAKKSPAELVEYIYAWSIDMRLLLSITANVDKKMSRLLQKRGILSIALPTLYYQKGRAIEFWQGIARPDGLQYVDPRMTARKYIESSRGTSYFMGVTPAKLSRQIAACWNSFYRGETLSSARVADELSIIKLLGTPYNGNQPKGFLSIRNETFVQKTDASPVENAAAAC